MTTLRLRSVSFDRVEFELESDEHGERLVTVAVNSVGSWRRSIVFPAEWQIGESGQSTFDDALDELIREKAAEELVRLEAAVAAVRALRHAA